MFDPWVGKILEGGHGNLPAFLPEESHGWRRLVGYLLEWPPHPQFPNLPGDRNSYPGGYQGHIAPIASPMPNRLGHLWASVGPRPFSRLTSVCTISCFSSPISEAIVSMSYSKTKIV